MLPKISEYITATGFAAVLNGRLQATDGSMGCYIAVETFCSDPEQAKILEGKCFDKRFIELMQADNAPIFTESGVELQDGLMPYSATVDPKTMKLSFYDDLLEDFVEEPDAPKLPDLSKVIYALTDGQPDVAKIQKRNTHFRGVNICPTRLAVIAESFAKEGEALPFLRLEFFHAQAAKDMVDKPSAAILVSPIKSEHPLYAEMAVIMPVF